ncbi:MAG: sodium:panthothenate symporter [Kiritimatiellae bacterium]|nr:sodium:panthothenate symporter [Kiritimatiellia bacterium]
MIWYDWLILILPVSFVMWMGLRSRRYVRGVSDFLSAGRLCGRYVISMGDVANALSIIGLVSYIEIHYRTGFSVGFWGSILAPLSIVMGLTGFVTYRFRETRAMSLGQFLEMRYSRRFRIAAAALRSLAEMVANMVMPAVAARFFIKMLDLPDVFHILGIPVSTFVALMVLFLTLAISLICFGGTLALVITDTIQGMILYPVLACFIAFLFWKFSVTREIMPVMADRVAGESFINPYDIASLRDFNIFTLVIVAAYGAVMNRANWIGAGYTTAAKNPQEQKMAGLLGTWRNAIINVFYILIAASLIAFLNHRSFAPEAGAVRKELAARVADDVFKSDPRSRDIVKSAIAAMPPQVHEIGVDPPLSQMENLDTAFLDVIHQALLAEARKTGGAASCFQPSTSQLSTRCDNAALVDAEGRANDDFQQCRTLYNQLILSATMRELLPHGLFGLFALLLFLAMLSTDDSRIYSAALTIAQDVILPLRRKPFTPKQHLWMIRAVAIGIGVFFLAGSYYMKQLDYYSMFNTLACAMWMGGAGAIMTFGLYSRFGTTAGAWAALGASTCLSGAYLYVQRSWADVVYPAIAKAGLVDPFDRALRWLSSPFEPYIHWQMDAVKCPVNAIEFNFFLSVLCVILYVAVSLATCRKPFNLDRMLHRGKYDLGRKRNLKFRWTPRTILSNLVGITPEYTRGDKAIAWGVFLYSFGYGFLLCFVGTVVWNHFRPWPIKWWSRYFIIRYFAIPCLVACVTTVWFGIGGVVGLRELFIDLRARKDTNDLDDGRVEGNVSLADKKELEEADRKED